MMAVARLIQTLWQGQQRWSRLAWLLLVPFALGFSALVRTRNALYDWRLLPIRRATPKVISVGNLTVGGSGKTPFVLWLAQALQQRTHYRIAILTHGYKGSRSDTTAVGAGGEIRATPAEVGDEAVMLARSFSGVVIAGKNRLKAAQLASQDFASELVILDDGFQHRRLTRDVDLLLIAGRQDRPGLDRQWLLPAGPSREPPSAARRADMVIVTKGGQPTGLEPDRAEPPLFSADLVPTSLVESGQGDWQELSLSLLHRRRVLAVAGIADPAPFYALLQEHDAELTEVMSFADHHTYTQADWQTIVTIGRRCDLIVTTEKDLVKLERFPFPTGKLVALRVRMQVRNAECLLSRIERQLAHQTEKMDDDHPRKKRPSSIFHGLIWPRRSSSKP